MRALLAAPVVFFGLAAAHAERADACSLFTPRDFVMNPTHADDVTAPTLSDVTYVVTRFDGGCEGFGAITINFVAGDDRAAVADLGFEISVVSGGDDLFGIPVGVRQYWWAPNEVVVHFSDVGQALDVELDVTAVDLNGNRSAPVRVHVQADAVDEGDEGGEDSGGCAAGGSSQPHIGALLVVLMLGGLALRCRSGQVRRGVRAHRA